MSDIAMVLRTIERMAGDAESGARPDIVLLAREGLAMVPAEDGGWTDWHGAGCAPVPLKTMVDIIMRDGTMFANITADIYSWRHDGVAVPCSDIVKWRRARP